MKVEKSIFIVAVCCQGYTIYANSSLCILLSVFAGVSLVLVRPSRRVKSKSFNVPLFHMKLAGIY